MQKGHKCSSGLRSGQAAEAMDISFLLADDYSDLCPRFDEGIKQLIQKNYCCTEQAAVSHGLEKKLDSLCIPLCLQGGCTLGCHPAPSYHNGVF